MSKEDVEYANDYDQWPNKQDWEEICRIENTAQPPHEFRCQHVMSDGTTRCGLPLYRDISPYDTFKDSERRCIFHIERERRHQPIREELQRALDNGTILERANLAGEDLSGLRIEKAELSDASLNDANLQRTTISESQLAGATFKGASLEYATFSNCNLAEAVLVKAGLNNARIEEDTILLEAQAQEANCEGARIRDSTLTGINLTGATLSHCRVTQGCRLQHAKLLQIQLLDILLSPDTNLHQAEWDENDIVVHEKQARERQGDTEQIELFSKCIAIYRQVKLAYQASGDYRRAGNFFFRETECQRALMAAKHPIPCSQWVPQIGPWLVSRTPTLSNLIRKIWRGLSHYVTRAVWWLSSVICQHGENPGRLLGVMAILIFVFALIHAYFGIQGHDGRSNIGPGLEFEIPDAEALKRLWQAVYFSVVTFTSLGYGDYSPLNARGQICASVEAFVGVILIAVFVGCIIRKLSR